MIASNMPNVGERGLNNFKWVNICGLIERLNGKYGGGAGSGGGIRGEVGVVLVVSKLQDQKV